MQVCDGVRWTLNFWLVKKNISKKTPFDELFVFIICSYKIKQIHAVRVCSHCLRPGYLQDFDCLK